MTNTIIEINHISKKYKIGAKQQYYSLRDVLTGYVKHLASKIRNLIKGKKGDQTNNIFWALKDVSFKVKEGEVVGIIGRNGAGKSTLLKILSRITPPTTGTIKLRGKVASLLEVGTGFHQELTGRENIYLNGAILGMRRKEVKEKFNEIVEFSEMEKFIDTPVKHYSSGMYARLAFAVAAFLESDILIVDEVLAVGDASFQNKCLGKMGDAAKSGRTVLFVSHNMGMIQGLCNRCVLMENGTIKKIGQTRNVINYYLNSSPDLSSARREWPNQEKAPGDDTLKLLSVNVSNEKGVVCERFDIQNSINIEIEYSNLVSGPRRLVGILLRNEEGQVILQSFDLNNKDSNTVLPVGIVKSSCHIPGNFLSEGRIYVDVKIGTRVSILLLHVDEHNVVSFTVEDNYKNGGVRGDYNGSWPGVVRPMLEWNREILK